MSGRTSCNDSVLLEPTLASVANTGLLEEVETIHLDRGYAGYPPAQTCRRWGIDDIVRTPNRPPGQARGAPKTEPLGQRWTDSPWVSRRLFVVVFCFSA
ncbi:MAG: hypothetical protein F4Z06_06530, partial [Acidimicrobiia bacterium]|nr:hypothetical protein [Acidimicrobiia bacterium]MYE72276.1 hypothetical protein [Acidimicrobiia bacterium]MYJ62262.1 hypothetical protein [Acidimicrobiia bacterium]